MDQILFWLFLIYDAVFELPYFWVKVAFGIATGLLIPGRIVGLLACAAVNAALFMYTRAGINTASLPLDGIAQLMWGIFAFAGVVWWVVGRVLRRLYFRIAPPAAGRRRNVRLLG
jgi:hypothetical protein